MHRLCLAEPNASPEEIQHTGRTPSWGLQYSRISTLGARGKKSVTVREGGLAASFFARRPCACCCFCIFSRSLHRYWSCLKSVHICEALPELTWTVSMIQHTGSKYTASSTSGGRYILLETVAVQ